MRWALESGDAQTFIDTARKALGMCATRCNRRQARKRFRLALRVTRKRAERPAKHQDALKDVRQRGPRTPRFRG